MGTNEQTLSSFSSVEVVFSARSVCVFAGWLCLSTWMEEDEKTQSTFGADPDIVTDQHCLSLLRDYCMDLGKTIIFNHTFIKHIYMAGIYEWEQEGTYDRAMHNTCMYMYIYDWYKYA